MLSIHPALPQSKLILEVIEKINSRIQGANPIQGSPLDNYPKWMGTNRFPSLYSYMKPKVFGQESYKITDPTLALPHFKWKLYTQFTLHYKRTFGTFSWTWQMRTFTSLFIASQENICVSISWGKHISLPFGLYPGPLRIFQSSESSGETLPPYRDASTCLSRRLAPTISVSGHFSNTENNYYERFWPWYLFQIWTNRSWFPV